MKILKKIGFSIIVVLCTILTFIIIIAIATFLPHIFAPKGTMFWVIGDWFNLIFVFEILCIFLVPLILISFKKKKKDNVYTKIPKFLKKHIVLTVLIFILLFYMMITDVTYITPEKIVHKKYNKPFGKSYSYSDVIGIDTGFYGYKEFLSKSKGEFYYYIIMNDGKRINLNNTGSVKEDTITDYDTYREIELIDEILMKINLPKISSTDYIDFASLGDVYKKRIESIILNK